MTYRGLTWDHPRGYNALAASGGDLIHWDKQPLEGFEAHPIGDLCARYDLVVLDHPHVGEAVAQDCLQPLESLFGADEIAALETDSIGPSLASYRFGGRHWALPLDAATQVMATRADLLDAPPPKTWDDVLALKVPVALSLIGPHAALTFQSIAAAHGRSNDPDLFVDKAAGRQALAIMAALAARTPDAARRLNPIGLLGLMASSDAVALCPLVYGYVNYAAPSDPAAKPIAFANAPRAKADGLPGSMLGGTGIGVSKRCVMTPALLDHLRWLLSTEAQTAFIPFHDGQPSRRTTWADAAVNTRWNNFYRNTQDTLEHATVRPRQDGAIALQTAASALIRAALMEGAAPDATVNALQDLYARIPGAER